MRPSLDGFWSTLSRLVGHTIWTLVCRVLSKLHKHGKWLVNFLIAIFWLSLYQPSQILAFSSCTLMWVQSQRLNLNSKALNGYTLQPTLLGTAQPKKKHVQVSAPLFLSTLKPDSADKQLDSDQVRKGIFLGSQNAIIEVIKQNWKQYEFIQFFSPDTNLAANLFLQLTWK